MIVYKYVTPERTDVLENCRIRFTQADALNDPFEVNPCFSAFTQGAIEHAKARVKGYTPTEDEVADFARQETQRFRNALFPEYSMLSLSKRNNNLLMWSHYAACHRGLVFGFDADHEYFTKPIPLKGNLLPVDYSKKRFVLPRAEDWKSAEDTLPAFLRKSEDWAYEEELRMFTRARTAVERKRDPQGVSIYLFPYPKECLVEVVFGIFTEDPVKKATIALVKANYPHVRLFQATLNESNFDLDIRPYDSKRPPRP